MKKQSVLAILLLFVIVLSTACGSKKQTYQLVTYSFQCNAEYSVEEIDESQTLSPSKQATITLAPEVTISFTNHQSMLYRQSKIDSLVESWGTHMEEKYNATVLSKTLANIDGLLGKEIQVEYTEDNIPYYKTTNIVLYSDSVLYITYTSPVDSYEEYLPEFEKTLKSIKSVVNFNY